MSDTSKLARRINREKKTISQMVALFCNDHHDSSKQKEKAYCGENICSKCITIDAYAVEKTALCRNMEEKTSCEACENHCYQPDQREQIRTIMRYAGPRMIFRHPIAALRHLMHK